MPTKPGLGRYCLAAFVVALEAPVVLTLPLGAAPTRALLAAGRPAYILARFSVARVAASSRREHSDRARLGTRLDHQG